jgi:uncharacterized protein (TIGR02391 family)
MIELFSDAEIESIAKIVGDGFTGSELTQFLAEAGVRDSEEGTKWRRVRAALLADQQRRRDGSGVAKLLRVAMSPARHVSRREWFGRKLGELNGVLRFRGLELRNDGKLYQVKPAATLDEALRRASRLREQLEPRKVHSEVLRYCTAEIMQDNYFHAVLEVAKGLAQRTRDLSGLNLDGTSLAQKAFGLGSNSLPILAINSLGSESEKSEQLGFMNLLSGVFQMFRNVTAHDPKITSRLSELDALDILTLASLLPRKLDQAAPTSRPLT